MPFHWTLLYTDALLYLLVIGIIIFAIFTSRHEDLRAAWRQITHRPIAMASIVILCCYAGIGLLDSIHFYPKNHQNQILSLLDTAISPLNKANEISYSAPFATHAYNKATIIKTNGEITWDYPALTYVHNDNVLSKTIIAASKALSLWLFICSLLIVYLAKHNQTNIFQQFKNIIYGKNCIAWYSTLFTLGFILFIGFWRLLYVTTTIFLALIKRGKMFFI